MQYKVHDLALFNLAIDSKLRGCDVVSLEVEDIAPHGYTMERATVRQKKTGRPVRFELTEQTRQAVDEYLRLAKIDFHDAPVEITSEHYLLKVLDESVWPLRVKTTRACLSDVQSQAWQ